MGRTVRDKIGNARVLEFKPAAAASPAKAASAGKEKRASVSRLNLYLGIWDALEHASPRREILSQIEPPELCRSHSNTLEDGLR